MRYLERAYPWLLLAPAALPVVVWSGLIYPYLVPKTLLFYAVSLLSVAMFTLLATHGHVFFWRRLARPEAWIPAVLLVLAYGTSVVGIDFYRSFWSIFTRGDGLLMLTCAVVDFYLLVLYVDRAFFERLLRAVAVVGSFVAVYGIGEWLMGGGRIGGLLGNAAFFAGYLAIAFFATLAAAESFSRTWRRAAFVGAALQIVAIVLTATRGTMLAFVAASAAYLAYLVFAGEGRRRTWSAGILIALAVSGGLFFAFRSELARSSFSPIARVASISVADSDVASRLFIWKNMLGEIQKSPWVGVGAEHVDVLFNRFYDPTQISEQWFDRSHNAFLDYAAQYGIGGLLLYGALILSFCIAALRFWRRGERRIAEISAFLAFVYAAQNFFVFDTISSFWLLLALLAGFLAMSRDDALREVLPVSATIRRVSWPFAFALVLLIVPFSVRPALAAYDLAHAYTYQLTDVPQEVNYLSHGVALGTYGDLEYGYQVYNMYGTVQSTLLTGATRTDAYQAALSILTANFYRYDYDARTALYLAHVLSLAPEGISIDTNLLSSALDRAIRFSPKRSQPWYILVNLSISEANTHAPGSPERAAGYAAARDLLSRYIVLVPTLSAPHFVLAELLRVSGDKTEAESEASKGKAYYVSDLDTARRAAGYYENTFDLPNAAYFLAEIVRQDPADTAAASDLAKIQAYLSR
ncbi:MAG: O-antigen ligase family protein [Minisyncoccia bacterium]